MYGFIPVIGVPFQALQLSNGDGTTITVTITVADAQARFSTSINNTSVRSTRIVFYDPDPTEVSIPAGITNIGTAGPRRWPVALSVSSA